MCMWVPACTAGGMAPPWKHVSDAKGMCTDSILQDQSGAPSNFTIHSGLPQDVKFSAPKRPHYWYAAASDCQKDDDTDMAVRCAAD